MVPDPVYAAVASQVDHYGGGLVCLLQHVVCPDPICCVQQASGFLFKDTVEVNALDDPEGRWQAAVAQSIRQPIWCDCSKILLVCSIAVLDATRQLRHVGPTQ